MRRKYLLTASAACVASVAMVLCPVELLAQREGKGRGGERGGGNVSRGESGRGGSSNREGGQSNRGNVSRGQSGRGEATAPRVTNRSGANVTREQNQRTVEVPAPSARVRTEGGAELKRPPVRTEPAPVPSVTNRERRDVDSRDVDRQRSDAVNRVERDVNRRNDWVESNRNRSDWDRYRGDWNRDRDRDGDRDRDWDRDDWNRWNNPYAGGNWRSPSYWHRYYGHGHYGNPFFGHYGHGYPGHWYPGFGYGYGGYGWLPGIGIGLGIGSLFRHGGHYYPGYYDGQYYTGYRTYTETPDTVITEAVEPTASGDFLESARAAFLAGDYPRAQKLAHHAIVDTPDNSKAHELMSLALFAQGNWVGAAEAAHAAVSLGSVADWPTLYGYYNDREKYQQHFNTLKQFVNENPRAREGHFVLGYHHLMMGNRDLARKHLADYLKMVDHQDPIGIKLFGESGGDVDALPKPTTPPPIPPAPREVDG